MILLIKEQNNGIGSDSWITTDHYNDLNLYLFYMHSYKYIIFHWIYNIEYKRAFSCDTV